MLNKTDLLSLAQCHRKLWLEHRRPELIPKDDQTLYRRAVDGRIVGEKARQLLGKVLWMAGGPDAAAAAKAARESLASNPGIPAVEVPMFHDGLYSRADALLPDGKAFILRETKSSTFPLRDDKVTPGAPEDHHLLDLAIQAWVMEGSGIPLSRAELNLLDNQWRYPGDGDYRGLFRQLDATASLAELKKEIPRLVAQARSVLAGDQPKAVTGRQCKDPYPCPFLGHCQKLDPPRPEHPIELLPDSAGKRLAEKLREDRGYTSILEPTPEELTGKQAALYQRIQKAHRRAEAILEPGADLKLRALPYPRYYFDFEGIDLPVPRWVGARPYEQVPFQWSCHIERAPGQFEHAEFLDLSGSDPSSGCIAEMLKVLDPSGKGPIIVYYATYERSRMADLALRFPAHAADLKRLIDRLFDLHPVVKEHYYHPNMRGSFSIKKVLPVVAPHLNYEELEEVTEGTAAQVAYLYAALDPATTPERKADLDAKLRKYCRQDTWAMVEVAYFLAGAGRPTRPEGM